MYLPRRRITARSHCRAIFGDCASSNPNSTPTIAPPGFNVQSVVSAPSAIGAKKDRKSTRLNSSHSQISYAVFCLKKKKTYITYQNDPDDPDTWTMTPYDIAAWSEIGRSLVCNDTRMILDDNQ